MPQDTQPRAIQEVADEQSATPLTAREMRAQTVHRLQVGLFGLCAMLLLVGLANIIMDRARLADEADPAIGVEKTMDEPKAAADPLADAGVVPAADPSATGDPAGVP